VQHDGARVDALSQVDFFEPAPRFRGAAWSGGMFRSPRFAAGHVAPGRVCSPIPLHGRHAQSPRNKIHPSGCLIEYLRET